MKILFITSYYSALKSSIEKDIWQPTGMPAITKLFEYLKSKNIYFDAIFIERDKGHTLDRIKVYENNLFKNEIHIFSVFSYSKLKRMVLLSNAWQEIYLFSYCLRMYKERSYDLVYIDRMNVHIAALFSILGIKTILRIHGVAAYLEKFSNIFYKFLHVIRYISFKAPFTYIVCSEDGTPVSQFLRKHTNSKVPSEILLNGIEKKDGIKIPDHIKINLDIVCPLPVLLFIGRFSDDKGIKEFIASIKDLSRKNNKFYTIIIGNGEYYNDIQTIIENDKLSCVKLISYVNHEEIYYYYSLSDIYISLNKYGNLSNTVLEATAAGNCIVTLKSSSTPLKDISTFEFFKDAAIYIQHDNIAGELPVALLKLIDDPEFLKLKKTQIQKCRRKLKSWDERLEKELDIFKKVIET